MFVSGVWAEKVWEGPRAAVKKEYRLIGLFELRDTPTGGMPHASL